ncbi:MAG: DUF2905 domain-containing protein [Bacteroidales bacterium]|nr:DUF2905 domain-containing protein [Bacteroidales bacterium]
MHSSIGKYIVIAGIMIVITGIVIWLFGDKLSWLGHLPGDIRIENENSKVYIPLTTMILVSVVLTILFNLLKRLF